MWLRNLQLLVLSCWLSSQLAETQLPDGRNDTVATSLSTEANPYTTSTASGQSHESTAVETEHRTELTTSIPTTSTQTTTNSVEDEVSTMAITTRIATAAEATTTSLPSHTLAVDNNHTTAAATITAAATKAKTTTTKTTAKATAKATAKTTTATKSGETTAGETTAVETTAVPTTTNTTVTTDSKTQTGVPSPQSTSVEAEDIKTAKTTQIPATSTDDRQKRTVTDYLSSETTANFRPTAVETDGNTTTAALTYSTITRGLSSQTRDENNINTTAAKRTSTTTKSTSTVTRAVAIIRTTVTKPTGSIAVATTAAGVTKTTATTTPTTTATSTPTTTATTTATITAMTTATTESKGKTGVPSHNSTPLKAENNATSITTQSPATSTDGAQKSTSSDDLLTETILNSSKRQVKTEEKTTATTTMMATYFTSSAGVRSHQSTLMMKPELNTTRAETAHIRATSTGTSTVRFASAQPFIRSVSLYAIIGGCTSLVLIVLIIVCGVVISRKRTQNLRARNGGSESQPHSCDMPQSNIRRRSVEQLVACKPEDYATYFEIAPRPLPQTPQPSHNEVPQRELRYKNHIYDKLPGLQETVIDPPIAPHLDKKQQSNQTLPNPPEQQNTNEQQATTTTKHIHYHNYGKETEPQTSNWSRPSTSAGVAGQEHPNVLNSIDRPMRCCNNPNIVGLRSTPRYASAPPSYSTMPHEQPCSPNMDRNIRKTYPTSLDGYPSHMITQNKYNMYPNHCIPYKNSTRYGSCGNLRLDACINQQHMEKQICLHRPPHCAEITTDYPMSHMTRCQSMDSIYISEPRSMEAYNHDHGYVHFQ